MPVASCDHLPMVAASPRVVIVHDYLTQRGGAERVVLNLLAAFPGARLVTSCWDRAGTFPEFGDHDIRTLWLQRIPAFRRDPRRAFPVLGRAFSRLVIADADVVICSSSGWAHRVTATGPKVVYCHNPARWLYQPDDYLSALPAPARRAFVRVTAGMRRSDVAAARTAAAYVVNSSAVAARVRAAYGIDADIVPPPRGLSPDGPQQPVDGIEPGYWLTIGRSRGYKNTAAVCAAMRDVPQERLVAVGGLPDGDWPANVRSTAEVSDAQLRWLYAPATGLVAVAHEDFGLTPVEAQAFGKPVIVLRSGGYLDTTTEDVTGLFVDRTDPERIAAAIRLARSRAWDAEAIRRAGEQYAPETFVRRMREVVDAAVARSGSS
jgi:glycosyltransferase involved in cell wall biosynthesis